jgi:hypothetical protein
MVGEAFASGAGCSGELRPVPIGMFCPEAETRYCQTRPDHYQHDMSTGFARKFGMINIGSRWQWTYGDTQLHASLSC